MLTLLRRPSAFLPLAMSATVLAFVFAHLAVHGTLHEADEGAGAHLFQILMPAQIPVIAFFAMRWLPQRRTGAFGVLALQAGTALGVFALVFAFHG